jgi:hypothetical protein
MATEIINTEKESTPGEAAFVLFVFLAVVFGMGFMTAKADFFDDFYLVDYVPYKKVELPEVGKCYRRLGYQTIFKVDLIHNGYAEYTVYTFGSSYPATDVVKARRFMNDQLLKIECPVSKEK